MDINLFILLGIILIALIVQYVVEAIKGLITAITKYKGYEDSKISVTLAPFIAIIFAIGLCILSGCDLFVAFGYPLTIIYVGETVTGIIASLGANKVYDLIMSFRDYKDKLAIAESDKVI